jgi:uncharacterized PurR-regulated membrane protein YhhQ (DUF165 family)
MTTRRTVGIFAFALYVLTVIAANWAVHHYGIVSVGFGLMAPAAVYFVGLAFTLRDITQEALGRYAVLIAIAIGAGLSYFVADATLATASAVAFGVSELADFAVYTPMRERGWLRAVVLSNIVGLVVDSILFLWIAFGSLAFLEGQIVGKATMTGAAVALLAVVGGQRRAVEA